MSDIDCEMVKLKYVNLPNSNMLEGKKWDEGKLRYDLIPAYPMEEVARVYTIGTKYGDWNWLKGIKYSRIIGAMFRHFYAWIRGEQRCPIDGQHHLSSVIWGAMTLMQYEISRPEFDDRELKDKAND